MYPSLPGAVIAAWWGYAEADRTVVGFLVVAIAIFALGYVGRRLLGRAGPRPRPDDMGAGAGARRGRPRRRGPR